VALLESSGVFLEKAEMAFGRTRGLKCNELKPGNVNTARNSAATLPPHVAFIFGDGTAKGGLGKVVVVPKKNGQENARLESVEGRENAKSGGKSIAASSRPALPQARGPFCHKLAASLAANSWPAWPQDRGPLGRKLAARLAARSRPPWPQARGHACRKRHP